MDELQNQKRAATAAVLIGIGLGGFVDGILLHQILQWHNMLSSVLPPEGMEAMQINMRWDGYFHAIVWTIAFVGVLMLWNSARKPYVLPGHSWFAGLLIIGWGLFNLIEGLIDHHLLAIHHVRGYGPNPPWDFGFLIIGGIGFIIIGWLLYNQNKSGNGPRS